MRLLASALVCLTVAVGIGACTGPDMPAQQTAATPPRVTNETLSVDPEQAQAEAVIRSLRSESQEGFAPEVLEATGDEPVLPPDAQVEPVPGTWNRDNKLATVDVIVHQQGGGRDRYWVFMEKRAGEWLVYMTIELGDDDE